MPKLFTEKLREILPSSRDSSVTKIIRSERSELFSVMVVAVIVIDLVVAKEVIIAAAVVVYVC